MQLEKTSIERFSHEKNDCSVLAFAHIFDISYERAHAYLKSKGRKDGKGFVTYLVLKHPKSLKNEFGKCLMEIPPTFIDGRRYRQTLRVFVREHKTGTYFIRINGHATVLKDGVILDRYLPPEGARVLSAYKVI